MSQSQQPLTFPNVTTYYCTLCERRAAKKKRGHLSLQLLDFLTGRDLSASNSAAQAHVTKKLPTDIKKTPGLLHEIGRP
jgi:hypothetical protein